MGYSIYYAGDDSSPVVLMDTFLLFISTDVGRHGRQR
jgi:hypothetical protein